LKGALQSNSSSVSTTIINVGGHVGGTTRNCRIGGGAVPVAEAISLNFICAGAFSLKKRSSILASALHILELRLLRTGGQRIRVAKKLRLGLAHTSLLWSFTNR